MHIWASPLENLSSVVCQHQMRRQACAYAQSDQRLCYSLIVKYHIQAWYKRNFNFLASLCSWAGWFESRYVGNPEDRFCRDEAHIFPDQPIYPYWQQCQVLKYYGINIQKFRTSISIHLFFQMTGHVTKFLVILKWWLIENEIKCYANAKFNIHFCKDTRF